MKIFSLAFVGLALLGATSIHPAMAANRATTISGMSSKRNKNNNSNKPGTAATMGQPDSIEIKSPPRKKKDGIVKSKTKKQDTHANIDIKDDSTGCVCHCETYKEEFYGFVTDLMDLLPPFSTSFTMMNDGDLNNNDICLGPKAQAFCVKFLEYLIQLGVVWVCVQEFRKAHDHDRQQKAAAYDHYQKRKAAALCIQSMYRLRRWKFRLRRRQIVEQRRQLAERSRQLVAKYVGFAPDNFGNNMVASLEEIRSGGVHLLRPCPLAIEDMEFPETHLRPLYPLQVMFEFVVANLFWWCYLFCLMAAGYICILFSGMVDVALY